MRIFVTLLFAVTITLSAQTKQAAKPTAMKDLQSPASDAAPGHLPVRRVVLYKNGIGYFEHTGRVRGNQEVNIDFTTSQLDDVLKSLTVVDLGEGRVTGVRYNSIAPIEQRLRGLRLPLDAKPTREELLNALLGAPVEVRNGSASATGKILSVETVKKENDRTDESIDVNMLSVVTDGGELRTFELTPSTSVRILDRDLNQELGRYFSMVGSSRAKDVRRMTISTSGSGDRDMVVSYVSEVPVWKTTYRIVIPTDSTRKPLLQGWAVVDNTVGEDWKDVKLSLIAGAPQSFIQQISTPLYARRPVVELPQTAQLTPQTYEGAVEEEKDENENALATPAMIPRMALEQAAPPPAPVGGATSGLTTYSFNGDANKALRIAPGMAGGGIGAGHGGGIGGGLFRNALATANVMMEQQFESAGAREIGELFSYDIKQPITIGKDQSALVPIVQARIDSEKVTIWNDHDVPRRALWMRNTSGATLDSGSFSIVEGDSFAGEGLMDPIKPNERRLLSYAADQGIRVKSEDEYHNQPVSHVRIARGVMTVTRQARTKRTYEVHNANTDERKIVIEHPARDGWKLADGLKAEETTTSVHRFLVDVKPGETSKLAVEEYHPEDSTIMLTNINSDLIVYYANEKVLKPETQQALHQILDQKNQINDYSNQINQRQQDVNNISNDQARVRENMKALKGSAEEKALVQRYASEMNKQEDRLAALRSEIASLQDKLNQANNELSKMIMAVDVDDNFSGE